MSVALVSRAAGARADIYLRAHAEERYRQRPALVAVTGGQQRACGAVPVGEEPGREGVTVLVLVFVFVFECVTCRNQMKYNLFVGSGERANVSLNAIEG